MPTRKAESKCLNSKNIWIWINYVDNLSMAIIYITYDELLILLMIKATHILKKLVCPSFKKMKSESDM